MGFATSSFLEMMAVSVQYKRRYARMVEKRLQANATLVEKYGKLPS
jgi:hypothetical protein